MSDFPMPSSYSGADRLPWGAKQCALHARDDVARLAKHPAQVRALVDADLYRPIKPGKGRTKATLEAMVKDGLLERQGVGGYKLTGYGALVREAAVRTIDR